VVLPLDMNLCDYFLWGCLKDHAYHPTHCLGVASRIEAVGSQVTCYVTLVHL
jgi:hypothetical protein